MVSPAVLADDLRGPLFDVTFAVIDLETTGCSPFDSAITEVGAARYRGGECLGTLQTLVDPGRGIPTHRALDDALATADLLHCLLERAGTIGVVALDHLLELSARRKQRPPAWARVLGASG